MVIWFAWGHKHIRKYMEYIILIFRLMSSRWGLLALPVRAPGVSDGLL